MALCNALRIARQRRMLFGLAFKTPVFAEAFPIEPRVRMSSLFFSRLSVAELLDPFGRPLKREERF